MNDPTPQQPDSAEVLREKAQHKQALVRLEYEHDQQALAGMPFAVRMYYDPVLYDRMNTMAERMAQSKGMPRHIQGDPIMGLYCIERGFSWGMSPLAVAMGTFKIGEQIGHYGRTIIAAINNSGRLEGPVKFALFEEKAEQGKTWDKVTANYREMESKKKQDEHGHPVKYLVPGYTRADEEGLGVIVSGHIKGEDKPRELKFYLKQAFPRNSTLWATDPATQLCYTAARRFGSLNVPDVVAGVRMEDDFTPTMRDVTPADEQPPARRAQPMAAPVFETIWSAYGEEIRLQPGEIEGWLSSHVRGLTADQLDQFAEGNHDRTDVRKAVQDEFLRRGGGEEPPPAAQAGPGQEREVGAAHGGQKSSSRAGGASAGQQSASRKKTDAEALASVPEKINQAMERDGQPQEPAADNLYLLRAGGAVIGSFPASEWFDRVAEHLPSPDDPDARSNVLRDNWPMLRKLQDSHPELHERWGPLLNDPSLTD